MTPALIRRPELARSLHISERTLRRLLPTVPGLAPIRAGRHTLFTQGDVNKIIEALRCPCMSASVAASIMSVASFASVRKPSRSGNTVRDAVTELLRKQMRPTGKRRSAAASLTVLPGGRGA